MAKKTRRDRLVAAATKQKPATLDDANLLVGYLMRLQSALTKKSDKNFIEDLHQAIGRAGYDPT